MFHSSRAFLRRVLGAAFLLVVTSNCAGKSKPPPTAEPEPAPVAPTPTPPTEAPAPAEPAGPDNSALIAALDTLDAAIAGCEGKLGTKKASECADAISPAVDGLAEPLKTSSAATELAASQQELKTHADKLATTAKGGKHKDQHEHFDNISRIAKDMRSKL